MPTVKWTGDRLPIGSVGVRQVVAQPATKAAMPPIAVDRFCRNLKHPNAQLLSKMNEAANQSVMHRSKTLALFPGKIAAAGVIASFGAGDRARWRFAFHTGPYTHAVCVIAVMHPPSVGTGTSTSTYGRLDIATNTAGTPAVASQTFVYGAGPLGTALARGWQYLKPVITYVDGLAGDTDYYGTFFDVDYGRIQSACVFDLQSMTENFSGYLPQNVTTHSAIVDKDRQNLVTISNALWKRGGAGIFSWSVDDGTAPVTIASATATNINDTTVTGAPTSSSPGFTPDMTGKARISKTTGVPFTMKAFAKNATPPGDGVVQIVDSSNTVIASISGGWTGTAGWQSATGVLPASAAKYDVQFKAATGTLSLYAVTVYEDG